MMVKAVPSAESADFVVLLSVSDYKTKLEVHISPTNSMDPVAVGSVGVLELFVEKFCPFVIKVEMFHGW